MEISSCCSSSPFFPSSLLPPRSSSSSLSFGPRRSVAPLVARRPRRRRSAGLECKCLFGLGVPELVVIAGVAALVFGPKKLPEIGKSLGKTVKSFQQAAKEFESEVTKTPPENEEIPQEVSNGEQKKELEASSTKETA